MAYPWDMLHHRELPVRALLLTLSLCLGALGLSAQSQEDDIDVRQLLKLNLSDWYFARYELGYERVLNGSTSFQVGFAGIGATEDFTRYHYNNFTGMDSWTDVQINHGGWRLTSEIRRYAWVYGGMPEGIFVSIMGRLEQWNLDVDEDIDDLGGIPVGQFQGELDGTWNQFHWGGGVMVGYQWYSDNGISLELYTGPMFRSYSRDWRHEAPLTDGEQEMVEDSLDERVFASSRWSPYLQADSGPGWRFGLTVGLGL